MFVGTQVLSADGITTMLFTLKFMATSPILHNGVIMLRVAGFGEWKFEYADFIETVSHHEDIYEYFRSKT